ncbi:helix-turn-helix domain-containing protein [Planctomicrobium sp. SH664]|uniref:helix-turn-helix domain-containing protein n=1 Tax=Planctomicrobium sp. SH664 TaxID=3448125 RepID=UPI003F5CA3EE
MLADTQVFFYDLGMSMQTKLISEALRDAIKNCGDSRYRLAQETGIAESNLSRFMNGQSQLSMKAVDRLCRYLSLELTVFRKNPESST